MSGTKNSNEMKPLEEMNVIDDFLFTELICDETYGLEVCRMILSSVLKREIGDISYTPQRTVPGVTEKSHGIRLDAFVKERHNKGKQEGEDISVYDIEPDKRSGYKDMLPKRSRYYGDLIDAQLLSTGTDYDKLPELFTIFILSYDPFGEGALYYEAGTIIKTHPHIPYNDGIRRIYLYVDGRLPEGAGEAEHRLMNLLKYIKESTEKNVTDDTTRKLNEIVKITKAKKDIGVRYMKSWEREREIREEERVKTEAERRRAEEEKNRADEEKNRADKEKNRADEAEAELAKYRERYGDLD